MAAESHCQSKSTESCDEPEVVLTILHFNDVYEIRERSEDPVGGAARFATAVKQFQHLNPLIVFSGDCLNPSLLSTITKGKHMVDILNKLGVNCAVYGNHEFDFGVDHLEEMVAQTDFPWFLSNVYDRFTSDTLGHGVVSRLVRWRGLDIGLMGLVEEEWLDTLGTVDKENLLYVDYVSVGRRLASELRSQGAELVVALTHMRWHNDARLAAETAGIDLILGGHDHEYGIREVNGVPVVKSGSDFRFLSKVDVSRRAGGGFRCTVQKVPVERRLVEDPAVKLIVDGYNNNVEHMLDEVLCQIEVDLDGRSTTVRREECILGNLITNAMLEATHADVALLNSGTLRSDTVHQAGTLTMHDLLQILPMQDPVLVVEATGQQLYEGLENSVRNYPTLDGRFPQVAGMQFGFDPRGPPGNRVVLNTIKVQGQDLNKDKTYLVAMKEYLTKGKDGYAMFLDCRKTFDIENAPTLSTILINHFESGKIIHGLKTCRSGHRMSLIKASISPSVSAVERTPRGKTAVVVTVPGVEGRIFHVTRDSQSEAGS